MSMALRFGRMLSVATAALILVAACGSTTSPGAGTPYIVGFQGGLTGTVAADPVSRLDGMRAYFDMINRQGGINNHPVNVVSRDDTGLDVAKGTTNFIEFRDSIKPS